VTHASKNEPYEYKPRVIEPMPERSFRVGDGRISGCLAAFLGILSFLGVLCYRFPSYLTTAELRAAYDAEFLQEVLKYGTYFSLCFALITFFLGKKRRLGALGA